MSESVICQLSISEPNDDGKNETRLALLSLEARNRETLSTLAEKETLLEKSEQQLQELMNKMNQESNEAAETTSVKSVEHDLYNQLAEKDKLLQDQQVQLEELKSQWEAERAELIKPALEQVTAQLEELKETVSKNYRGLA